MRGGPPKGTSEQWMRNALASGSIVAPRGEPSPRERALGKAWIVVFSLGVFALLVAACLL